MNRSLTPELLSLAFLPFAWDEGQGHDTGNVHLGAEDSGVETQLLRSSLHVLQTLLVVGASTSYPDLDIVLNQLSRIVPQSADDTLECAGDIREIGNTAANEKHLTLVGHGGAKHEVQDGTGVVISLRLGGGTRVFTVVGELVSEAGRSNSVSIHDGRTATSHKSPDTAVGIQYRQLQRSTGLGIHLSNVSFLLGQLTAERGGELHRRPGINVDLLAIGRSHVGETQSSRGASNSPLDAALEVGGLVQLRSQIQEVDCSRGLVFVGDHNQGVDLEIGELAVDIDGIKARDEVDEDIVNTLGNLLQKSSSNLLI